MADPESLLEAIRTAEENEEVESLDSLREEYLACAPSTPEATEARYRLGLSYLFRRKNMEDAKAFLKEAASDKSHPIAPAARVSYALLLNAQQKRQQAMFELRKLLTTGQPPTVHTASALDFLSLLLRESGAQAADIEKVEEQRRSHLETLAEQESDPMEKAHWWLRLGTAYADGEEPWEWQKARSYYQEIIKLGATAGKSAIHAARDAMKTLPR